MEKKVQRQTDRAKYNKAAKNDYLQGKSSEMPKSFKKIFTDEEAREIVENTVRFRKSDKRIYTLICLWLCSLLQRNDYKQLKVLTNNAPIDVMNFDNNHELVKEVVHSILEEMLAITPYKFSEKRREELGLAKDEQVLRGLVYHIDWKMPNKQILKFTMGKVQFALYRAVSKLFRSQQATSNHFTEKNKEKMKIITDIDMYQYRQILGYGNYDNFVHLTKELEDRVSSTTDNTKKNSERMNMYDEMYKILNSNSIKLVYRDFLKAKFKIPSMMIEGGVIKEFILEIKDFFKLHKEYYKILNPIVSVTNNRGKKVEKYTFDEEYLKNTDFYREAIKTIKKQLISNLGLEVMQDKISDDVDLFDEEDIDWSDSWMSCSSDTFDKIRGQY